MTTQPDALGHPDPGRYLSGGWPVALLERMAFWVRRVHHGGHLLDLGCAEGALLSCLGERGVGLDLNPDRLRLAADKGIRVCLGDGGLLPFPDHCFDTVVSMEVLEHVPDMSAVMAEVHRVLRPGGNWVISVPNVTLRSWYEMWREGRPYYCDEKEHYREFSPVRIPWFKHRFMHVKELERMLRNQGFEIWKRDGVRYLFPQWFFRAGWLQRCIESSNMDRAWSSVPWICLFPYWRIMVLEKGGA
ncbi:class I SAM-dependent methyltransferase [Alcanivorax sp.]|uniref:class I SAM-dependent methyltransferase n=1 Tax=Alcanivorax sp. TaxID=1872427 RepID=UPI00258C7216|nr:class I SAM-dependent methyltransferase [Alcanivorax sp.]